jgi:signal transduction histidine kinase
LTKPQVYLDAKSAVDPAASSTNAGAGWIPWYSETRLHLLGWVEPAADAVRYGVEVEMMALLARLVGALPSSPSPGEAYALVDGNGEIFHQTGAAVIDATTPKLVTLPIGPALPHWQLSVYAPEGSLVSAGKGGFLLISTLVVGSFVAAVVFGGSLLLWQAYRNMADARRKTTFVSNVSHELKTPLTTIRMYAELLLEGRVKAGEKSKHYLNVIVTESQRLTRLVNNVLDFSRLEQGRKKYTPTSLDLAATLNGVLDTQAVRLDEAGMRLERRIPDDALPLDTDRDALEQVVINLVDNAIKYAAQGRELAVELAAQGEFYRLRILDRGPGVPPSHRRRIFDVFHRVDDSLTARHPGSGLGLSIARQILDDLGGRLTYTPRAGGGSCFEITLPPNGRR